MKESHSGTKSFSAFAGGPGNDNVLSYESVPSHFGKVKKQKVFNDKLEKAKAGNQDILVKIDDQFCIVDKTGWILINSDKDLISINDDQKITVGELNSTLKRRDTKGMTPLDKKETKFVIYTKKNLQGH